MDLFQCICPLTVSEALHLCFSLLINKCSRSADANQKQYVPALTPSWTSANVQGINGTFGRDEFIWSDVAAEQLCGPLLPPLPHLT